MFSLIPFLLALLLTASGLSFDTSAYEHHQQLRSGPDYDIFWTLDDEVLYLAIQVETTGWFGFGLAEEFSWSMLGADVVTVWVGEDLESSIVTDRAVGSAHVLPHEDSCQDWVLLNVASENGYSFAELVRFRETADILNDRPILVAKLPQSVIFAWGENGSHEVAYHENRQGKALVGWNPSLLTTYTAPSDVRQIRLEIDVEVPVVETAYRCFGFYLPDYTGVQPGSGKKIQITKAGPEVDHADVLHHLLARRCSAPEDFWQYYKDNFGADCLANMPWSAIGAMTTCKEGVYTWGIGQPEFTFPDEVGMPADEVQYLLLEVHYNNPTGIVYAEHDRTAIILEITETPRKYDAAISILGDPSLSLPPIPNGVLNYYRYTSCPSECTSQFPGPITIFAVMIHMHQWATGASMAVYRDGEFVREIFDTDFYEFHNQNVWHVTPGFVMQPGDEWYFSCKYDTRAAPIPVAMGETSLHEMCTPVIYWYPKLSTPDPDYPLAGGMPACGYMPPGDASICGTGMVPVPNPKNPGPEEDRLAAKPRGFSSDQPSVCATVPGAAGALHFNILLLVALVSALLFI
jgi:hypothetical protein